MPADDRAGFEGILAQLRAEAESTADQGRRFERLMKRFLQIDPVYQKRFKNVWLWNEWPGRGNHTDTGIDLVAEEREGGCCAIQCKFYASETRIGNKDITSFITASNREPFTSRLLINTGADLGANIKKTIPGLQPPMQILRFGDLADRAIHWPDDLADVDKLEIRPEKFKLRPYQKNVIRDVAQGFKKSPRGRLIMPCGTGKTFTALRIAEEIAGLGGRVLYLVPSIALLGQTLREWATQQAVDHRYIGICSDVKAGKDSEDASISELEIPVTTNRDAIGTALRKKRPQNLTVVFCTYHSLEIVAGAQADGAPQFDLVLCDEAHRTTGVEKPGDKKSPFVLIHDGDKVRAKNRLYMTATPRIYAEGAKTKASDSDIGLFSMDDENQYGPEFYRMEFSEAIDQKLLSDYRVVVLNIGDQYVSTVLQKMLAHADGDPELNLDDAGRMLGCWRALEEPEGLEKRSAAGPLRRAIAFTNRIKDSKLMADNWHQLVEEAIALQPDEKRESLLRCEVQHVDGQQNAFMRKERIDWLKKGSDETCTILSNARCLSEGVDVPALDAVLFMQPRRSSIDVVQAVGRVMRKAPDKKYGYIILPIVVPVDEDPAAALDDNERYQTVWDVLRALRSHDNRFNDEINRLDLNKNPPERVIGIGIGLGEGGDDIESEPLQFPFAFSDLPMDAFYAKVVEKCGDRQYWETWAKDIAEIVQHLTTRINALLKKENAGDVAAYFSSFLKELRASINESVSQDDAVAMVAQHMITGPVFNALFENYDFATSNPVAQALSDLVQMLEKQGLETETRDLEKFYDSVRRRAQGLDNPQAKQRVLVELYEKFFKVALPRETARLGIAYTPPEVVDFILHSADHVMRDEFGRGLTDKDVHIIDPFTGTGIFLARLLQSGLIRNKDLERKFREEMHANEIVLLAYYIAAVNIEEAFHAQRESAKYEPFPGIVFCDTFRLADENVQIPGAVMLDNDARRKRQRGARIEVVVGNPPYSAWQTSADDKNPNVDYPAMRERVRKTYAARSTATNRSSLYDTYKMAIRWATDRIEQAGVVAFVTNGSYIDGNADGGLRACLVDEFDSIYVYNLRGNQRTQGETSRKEGGKIFGQGSRAPIAITVLVKNPATKHKQCQIFYKDIGDYWNRRDKLSIIKDARSIQGIGDWLDVTPDENHDWINQRDADYQNFLAVGSPEVKANKLHDTVFRLYSSGVKTGRDGWLYNFSKEVLAGQTKKMTDAYERVRLEIVEQKNSSVEDVVDSEDDKINWDREILQRLARGTSAPDLPHAMRTAVYRPFVKCNLAFNLPYIQMPYQIPQMFPETDSENLAICVTGRGTTKSFSALMVDTTPDLEVVSKSQCFPLHAYKIVEYADRTLPGMSHKREKRENILDETRTRFRLHYGDDTITKEDIFYYVYGLLHAPDYKERYQNDLARDLPRIPYAPDFRAFVEAGRKLGNLHINYETCERHSLDFQFTGRDDKHYRLTKRKMRFDKGDNTTLIVNDYLRLGGIPAEAHEYEVNGRTPLGWFIDRYRITQDKKTGNINDPNAWFAEPRDLIAAIERIVHTSISTARIIKALPPAFED